MKEEKAVMVMVTVCKLVVSKAEEAEGGVLVVVDESGVVIESGGGCDDDGDGWVAGESGGGCDGVRVSCEDVSEGDDSLSERTGPRPSPHLGELHESKWRKDEINCSKSHR